EFVRANMRCSGNEDNQVKGALGALALKYGTCREYTDLFVALCRAKGIPARVCEGLVITPTPEPKVPNHGWAEVHIKDYGWVPFDPLSIAEHGLPLEALPQPKDTARGLVTFQRSPNWYVYNIRGWSNPVMRHQAVHWRSLFASTGGGLPRYRK